MIKIAGKEFRTLAHPIYVDGKHVREVWANGEMVYPETVRGNTIKIRGHITEGRSYFRPERNITRYEPWMNGEIVRVNSYTETFTVSASFVAVFRYSEDVGLHQEGVKLIPVCGTSFTSENVPTEGEGEYVLPYDLFYSSWNEKENYLRLGISPICMPLSPLDGSPVPTIPTLNIVRQEMGNLLDLKILFRIDMAPIPLSGEYYYTYYNPLNFYHTDRTIPIHSGMFSACDWNGRIIRSENYSTVRVPNPWDSDASLVINLGSQNVIDNQDSVSPFPSQMSVSLRNIKQRATLISNFLDCNETRIDATINNLVNIPVTDVLYLGMAEDAPDWALDVFESDL